MVPRRGVEIPEMQETPVFIGAGKNDHMCPAQSQRIYGTYCKEQEQR